MRPQYCLNYTPAPTHARVRKGTLNIVEDTLILFVWQMEAADYWHRWFSENIYIRSRQSTGEETSNFQEGTKTST